MSWRAFALSSAAMALLAGCAADPDPARIARLAGPLPVPARWPAGAAYPIPGDLAQPAYSYRAVFGDARLVTLIDRAQAHNQDVALAIANVAAARAQFQAQRAAQFPQIGTSLGYNRAGGTASNSPPNVFTAEGTLASYEVDLFGRLRDLTTAQRATYLASRAAAQAARLMVAASTANAWLAYGADASLLSVARQTAASASTGAALTAKRVRGGIAPLSDQRQAELIQHIAEADVAAQTNALAQDANALRLLVGAEVSDAELPGSIDDAGAHLAEVPAGLDSAILLRRPDVVQAEYALAANDARVGAARAALFPKITLTGVLGVASTALSSLFTGGAFAFAAGAGLSYPIFDAGAARAGLQLSQAQREAALAEYRKAIEAAFSDVANALARRGTIDAQLSASTAARDAAADNARLARERYTGGVATHLESLTAEQALYTQQKALVAVELARANNLVGLYRALGGDDL